MDHRKVVVGIPCGEGAVVEASESLDFLALSILKPHDIVAQHPLFIHFQAVAHDHGPGELLHQWTGELAEGVAENYHLRLFAEIVQKCLCTIQRLHGSNNLLDIPQAEMVLRENLHPVAHQLAVVRFIPSGDLQCLYSGLLAEADPNLRNQSSFQIQTNDIHSLLPFPSHSKNNKPLTIRFPSMRREDRRP